MKAFHLCIALALGEGLAALLPSAAPTWPVFAIIAALVSLIGFGLGLGGWKHIALALLGAALFFHASLVNEMDLRDSPWMRNASRRPRAVESARLSPIRRDLSRRVALGLDHDRGVCALNRAIMLGERDRIPPRMKRMFVDSGTIHVFAISGLHVMVIAKTLTVLLSLLFVPTRLAGAAALPLVWGYVFVIGCPPSAVRAALMASFYFSAPVWWRRPDAVRAWALAFLSMHLANPLLIADTGSQLSFAVMLAILVSGRLGAQVFTGWQLKCWITFAAWAAGVPIAAAAFGRLTPGGVLANLVLITAAACSVMAGTIGLLASFLSNTLAAHLNNLSALFTHLMADVADGVSRLPFASFEVPRWGFLLCAEWYAALALSLYLLLLVADRRNRSL